MDEILTGVKTSKVANGEMPGTKEEEPDDELANRLGALKSN
jgi:hypothetical protein